MPVHPFTASMCIVNDIIDRGKIILDCCLSHCFTNQPERGIKLISHCVLRSDPGASFSLHCRKLPASANFIHLLPTHRIAFEKSIYTALSSMLRIGNALVHRMLTGGGFGGKTNALVGIGEAETAPHVHAADPVFHVCDQSVSFHTCVLVKGGPCRATQKRADSNAADGL